MKIAGKILKVIGKILLVLLILILALLLGMFLFHCYKSWQNHNAMYEFGYYNGEWANDDLHLNVLKKGNNEGDHRIIVLSGAMPCHYFDIHDMLSEFEEDNAVVYLSRPGYDGSDDTNKEMTPEFVVENYRAALKSAQVKTPYVLLPHSLGGLYASYWVSKYPDEIEGMIDIDGVCAKSIPDAKVEGGKDSLYYLANMGVFDVAMDYFRTPNPAYSESEQWMHDVLTIATFSSKAIYSEGAHYSTNLNEVWNTLVPNDVPKIYIAAFRGIRTKEEAEEALRWQNGEDFTDEDIQELLNNSAAERKELEPYLEKLGSCELIYLPGDHFIFEQKPEECAAIIRGFLDNLNE